MSETTNIVALRQPDEIEDPLTNILRAGAQQRLPQAIEIEVETLLATLKDLTDGRWRADPVQLNSRDPAAVGAAAPKPGYAAAGTLPARHFRPAISRRR